MSVPFLYKSGIKLYGVGIRLASLWSDQARLLIDGRKKSAASLKDWKSSKSGRVVWFHCASHGEYEQGLPLIQELKNKQPDCNIVITFYSPSGYIATKNKTVADWVGYIPLDTPSLVDTFLDNVNPDIAIFIKNEWWWTIISSLQKRDIPIHHISSTVRDDHYFIKRPKPWLRKLLEAEASIGLVDIDSENTIKRYYSNAKTYVSGDLRACRTLQIAQTDTDYTLPGPKEEKVFIHGSVWPADMHVVCQLIIAFPDFHHYLFPHKLDKVQVDLIENHINNQSNVTLVLEMGTLSNAYRYANYVYVGGGYGAGIHNILEPAVYGVPVLIGPNCHKSREATELTKLEAAFVINQNITPALINQLNDEAYLKKVSQSIELYFSKHSRALDVTYNHIFGESLA